MRYLVLKKSDLDSFLQHLAAKQRVVAPLPKEDGQFSFEDVKSGHKVAIHYVPTILPPKKYFTPQYETLLEYDTHHGQHMQAVVDYESMVIFGMHTCDLAGVQCLNAVFSDRPKDQNYLIRRTKIAIIGMECNQHCDEHATCALMDNHLPNGGYDLFFTDLGDDFIVHINTYTGLHLLDDTKLFTEPGSGHFSALNELRQKKRELFKPEVNIDMQDMPRLFDQSVHSRVWEDIGAKCLSCGNCTNVCPTCYCFDVVDEPNLDLKIGRRFRVWDSCQNERFAKISGGESFRKTRASRKKHRFYRKFRYPMDRYGKFFCTGCGRCTRTCMAKINLKETLTLLAKEQSAS